MSADIDAKLDRLQTRIERLDAEVATGALADLGGLDTAIAGVCREVAALPAETRRPLQPRLDDLLARLDALEGKLRDQFEGVKAELQAHGRRSQATRAYNQSATRTRREP